MSESKDFEKMEESPVDPPKLVRENYDHLPWKHRTFESWKDYVSKNAKSDGLVYPSINDSYCVFKGYGLDDWKLEYANTLNLEDRLQIESENNKERQA